MAKADDLKLCEDTGREPLESSLSSRDLDCSAAPRKNAPKPSFFRR